VSTPDLMGELNEVDAQVREHLAELLDVFDREGGRYARSYAESVLTRPARMTGPRVPNGLHSKVAAAIRDIVMDELSVRRRIPARLR
jgi:hypothetical protein